MASAKLEKSVRNKAMLRARSSRAMKASAVSLERMREVMSDIDRLTAQCDELALEIQIVPRPAIKAEVAREFKLNAHRLEK